MTEEKVRQVVVIATPDEGQSPRG
ncbi:protein of unknown function [Kyrpidia spormannii]|uniref:Uncharacterized protein n=1 Tax=Kyrpidia spormannii TaxID=2055160 RepID=A0ACA8ZBF9_9BACL|nr:protein of unknown function [Kyrpidia spormannii]